MQCRQTEQRSPGSHHKTHNSQPLVSTRPQSANRRSAHRSAPTSTSTFDLQLHPTTHKTQNKPISARPGAHHHTQRPCSTRGQGKTAEPNSGSRRHIQHRVRYRSGDIKHQICGRSDRAPKGLVVDFCYTAVSGHCAHGAAAHIDRANAVVFGVACI